MKKRLLVTFCVLAFLHGCTWVKVTEGGKTVQVVNNKEQVTNCKSLGKTTVTVASEVAGLKRKEHIVEDNLQSLAKNSAADMGGDTILAISGVSDGKQTFAVYKCNGK